MKWQKMYCMYLKKKCVNRYNVARIVTGFWKRYENVLTILLDGVNVNYLGHFNIAIRLSGSGRCGGSILLYIRHEQIQLLIQILDRLGCFFL
jgi:hypothetical protein